MRLHRLAVAALALGGSLSCGAAFRAAAAPSPRPFPFPLPTRPLHTSFVVEVNAKGQVVRVTSASWSPDGGYNRETYGNVLQIFIRHPDGSAETGLYRVRYDYDPRTHRIHRSVALLKAGGSWAHQEGAAVVMMRIAKRNLERRLQAERAARERRLPSLHHILHASPSPSPHS